MCESLADHGALDWGQPLAAQFAHEGIGEHRVAHTKTVFRGSVTRTICTTIAVAAALGALPSAAQQRPIATPLADRQILVVGEKLELGIVLAGQWIWPAPDSLSAQLPAERRLPPATAHLSEDFTSITSMRELRDGRVLITDPRGDRFVVADFRTDRLDSTRSGGWGADRVSSPFRPRSFHWAPTPR